MAYVYTTSYTLGEELRTDDASCCPGRKSVEDLIKNDHPEAVELIVPKCLEPFDVRYFVCKNRYDNDYIRAVWIA